MTVKATWKRAAFVAGTYFVVASIYIVVSSNLAETASADIDTLRRFEQLKGLLFVAVTAAVVFAATFGTLSRANRAARELASQREALVTNERRALAGMLAAAIAHDANNVLASLTIDLELLDRGTRDEASLLDARAAVARLADLNRRLLNAARQSTSTDLHDVDVGRAARDTLAVLHFHPAVRECTVAIETAAGAMIRANPVLIHQVVGNFVINAGEATGGKGRIALSVQLDPSSGDITVTVDDDGPGVPPDQRAQIFSALKTTKPSGSGLGLFSARACAAALGGYLEVGDSPLGGARFTLIVPGSRLEPGARAELTPASSS